MLKENGPVVISSGNGKEFKSNSVLDPGITPDDLDLAWQRTWDRNRAKRSRSPVVVSTKF